jgi:hypothetical protein
MFLALPFFIHASSGDISCWISASPRYIEEGEATRLTWGSYGADEGYITDLGNVSSSGSRTLSDIEETTTFTFTAENGDDEDECSVTVYVDSSDARDLSCSIEREYLNTNDGYGRPAMLRWNSDGAERAHIDMIGFVALNGAQVVYMDGEYRMTVYDGDDEATCSTREHSSMRYYDHRDNYVYRDVSVPQYIHLTQIPHTGVGLGFVAESLLWLSITISAFAGATYIARRRQFLTTATRMWR